jgi:hypothetical protein
VHEPTNILQTEQYVCILTDLTVLFIFIKIDKSNCKLLRVICIEGNKQRWTDKFNPVKFFEALCQFLELFYYFLEDANIDGFAIEEE